MPSPSLSCLINPLWPSPSFTAFHKTRMKWGRKTSPVLKALNNLLSQFSNNLNQFDVLSNKICCCTPISAAPWMTVNLHFLIKLAGIFIRGLGYANGNVVYSRLTEFWNKFNRETFGGKKCESLSLTSFMPISPGGSLYSRSLVREECFSATRWLVSPCQPRKNTRILKIYFLNTLFKWYQNRWFLSSLTYAIEHTETIYNHSLWFSLNEVFKKKRIFSCFICFVIF